ncbi:MAG: MtrB/PioB family decaheme-associated outer membrane protein [Gammaproteobacteria bacterium]|nr:MtrB/PioB family decaheme-associated outer membrane protein [Gammaproteobacteria bacterium]MDH4314176.1 MtrB/PioB family decaheme-associated outer membrane protein [Gammaproteobacteria bacterium]MDH5212816.1 MtrB/PioB family decaheme-associated outer membrane protein [Gammaproteobacteria bacterium]
MQLPLRPIIDSKILSSLFVAATLALSYMPAANAQVDPGEWKCEFCPFTSGYDAEVDVGAAYVSDDAARFGNANGYDEAGAYVDLGGEGHYANDGYQLNWFAEDLGLASRVFEIDGGHQGSYGFYLGYSELPYRLFDTTSTVYTASAPDSLTLPSGWVRANQTSGFTNLASSLVPQNIESDRKNFTAGGHFLASSNFRFYADYRHLERDGVDMVSGANFTQASILPRVLDNETDLIDLGVGYSNGPLNLSLAWLGSFFTNNVTSLTWENAFTAPAGEELRRMAQEPDNDFQQLSLSGSYRFNAYATVIAFSASMGQGGQNDSLLPYTINPNIAAAALPKTSLDGKVDTSNYAVTLTANPLPKTRIKLAYRYDERDNQTAQVPWSRVIVDSFASGETELNTPYSFKRMQLNASGSYDLFDDLRVSAGYDRTDLDRSFQEVASQTEDSGWARVKWQTTEWLSVNAKGGASSRDIDRYDTTVAAGLGQNPLMRKYNLAYRYREFGELMASISPMNLPVSVSLSALWADDSYTRSTLGMTGSTTTHWNLELNWAVSARASVYVFGGEETIEADQAGSEAFAGPDWFANHEDDFLILGGGLQLAKLWDNTDLRLDYTHTEGDTRIAMTTSASGRSQFPSIDTTLESLRVTVNHKRSEKLELDLSLRYESFDSNDWAIAGVEPDTIPTVLSLGANPYDYDVWVLGLSIRYRIGAAKPATP